MSRRHPSHRLPKAAVLFVLLGLTWTGTVLAQTPASEVVELLEQAMTAVDAGDVEAAIAVLAPLRERTDPPPEAMAVLGALYLEAGLDEEALAVLAPLAEGPDANAAVLYNAGRAAVRGGDLPRGVAWLQRSAALQPGTPATRELGLLHGALGQLRDAYRLLVPWARSHPQDTQAVRAAALAALRLRRVPTADELLASLPQNDPENRMLWGHLLLLKGEPHAAVSMLAPLLSAAEPLSAGLEADVRGILAEAYLEVGEATKSVEMLEGRVDSAASALLLARAWYQSGELDKALATAAPLAEPILEREHPPDDPRWSLATEIAREYGRWLLAAGRAEEAIPYLEIATRREPDRKEGWQALGQALAAAGRQEEARSALDEFQRLSREVGSETAQMASLRLAREDPTAAEIARARRLVEQGRSEEALAIVAAEAEISLDDPRPGLLVSWLLLTLDRADEAQRVADRLVARHPGNPDALHQRGATRMASGRPDEAEADFRRALELAPTHVPSLNDLAVLLIVRGERAEARTLLERVLELRPEDEQAREGLERLRAGG